VATLAAEIARGGMTIETVARWLNAHTEESWRAVWAANLPALERAYQRSGEPAYGVYGRDLFQPADSELRGAGLVCEPSLPGSYQLSVERWGPPSDRERRLWSVVRKSDGDPLGALVTRFFHDHTRLRLPRSPTVFAVGGTDHDAIRAAVERR
jgi:hypothetical protein